jgi:hypothetical protein
MSSNIKPEDMGALFVANGMGERDDQGDYIKMVILNSKAAHPSEYLVSRGQAENLASELTALVLKMMRRVSGS